jgi:hypothetical protein
MSNFAKSTIKIYKNNNQIETLELPPVTDDDKNNSFMDVRNLLQKFISDGYTITATNEVSFSTSNGMTVSNKIIATYILEKK